MNSSKRIIIYSLLSVITILVAITGLTYAYFTANIVSNTGNNNITVHTTIGNCEDPVFTSYTTGDIEMEVTTADMLESEVSSGGFNSGSILLYVKFIGSKAGNNGTCNESITCTYDVVYHNEGDTYVYSPIGNHEKDIQGDYYLVFVPSDFSFTGIYNIGSGAYTIYGSPGQDNIETGGPILLSDTISSNGTLVTKYYNVAVVIENRDYDQSYLMNKHFKHSITVENIVCS